MDKSGSRFQENIPVNGDYRPNPNFSDPENMKVALIHTYKVQLIEKAIRNRGSNAPYLSDGSGGSANDSGDVRILIENVNVVIGQNSHDRRLWIATRRTS